MPRTGSGGRGDNLKPQTSAHTAEVRRRRAIDMVATLIMGAAIRPAARFFVKMFQRPSGMVRRTRRLQMYNWTSGNLEISGFASLR